MGVTNKSFCNSCRACETPLCTSRTGLHPTRDTTRGSWSCTKRGSNTQQARIRFSPIARKVLSLRPSYLRRQVRRRGRGLENQRSRKALSILSWIPVRLALSLHFSLCQERRHPIPHLCPCAVHLPLRFSQTVTRLPRVVLPNCSDRRTVLGCICNNLAELHGARLPQW